jgi:hypothetical protein
VSDECKWIDLSFDTSIFNLIVLYDLPGTANPGRAGDKNLYYAKCTYVHYFLPPNEGWRTCSRGVRPAPSIRTDTYEYSWCIIVWFVLFE